MFFYNKILTVFIFFYFRPPRQRKEDTSASTTPECEWQGENWRKNSKWGPGSREGPTPPTTPLTQVPPALPAPPSTPQENLFRVSLPFNTLKNVSMTKIIISYNVYL